MAAGFRSPLPPLGLSAGHTARPGFKGLFAFWSGGAAVRPVSAPGFKSLLAFWAGGAARGVGGGVAPVTPTATAGYPPKRRKRPVWIGEHLAELVDGHSPQFIEESLEAPRYEDIREVAKAHKQEAAVVSAFEAQDYSQMLALYDQMLEEDDIETLLILL